MYNWKEQKKREKFYFVSLLCWLMVDILYAISLALPYGICNNCAKKNIAADCRFQSFSLAADQRQEEEIFFSISSITKNF